MALKVGAGGMLPPFVAMDVIAAANARERTLPPGAPGVIHMEVGQPGTGAPAGAAAAAMAALRDGAPMGYTEALGRPGLRARIAAHYRDWYGVAVAPERVAVTTGASGGFALAFLAAFDRGDRVAMAAPYYPPYANILLALGMTPVTIPTEAATRFQPTVAQLDALDPVPDGLVVASPGNPAGTMLAPDDFAAIVAWCAARGVRLISDEIYHGLTYGSVATVTAAGVPDAIVVNSFSKYFSMTGWRVGWLVLPETLVRPVECLAQNLFISAPHISQIAAEAAFDCHDELRANVARYARSRAVLLDALPAAGLEVAAADGAFYLYADARGRTADSVAFCARLLAEAGIAATPGIDFDAARGRGTVRFSYCGPETTMRQAAERLRRFG